MKKLPQSIAASLVLALASTTTVWANDVEVKISAELGSVDVMHEGKKATIMRDQNQEATVNPAFAKTSRKCPPFCIQPSTLAPGVETIGELEILDYLKKMSDGDDSILVIDSRTPDWVARGTIPGAINVPWKSVSLAHSDPLSVAEVIEEHTGATQQEGFWDFSNAKTLVLFCNGMWCGQSPTNIKTLLKVGYPAHKIKWYRGGMQAWSILGLSTVTPK